MTPQEFERIRELFLAARKLDPSERAEYLDQACASEPNLRPEVEALLDHQDNPNDLLERPSRFAGLRSELEQVFQTTDAEPVPERIGRYSILGTLGGGGMGIVYLAEQEHPRRKVALKIVRSGGSSRVLLRRFEHEASILGHLDHPGIAHIHEAGVADMHTKSGLVVQCPYFAMEYVEGESLGEYAKRRALGPRERLALIATICEAVHHAHQKGVVHRDLKPGNILVTRDGQPKILDFGVARVTDADIQTVTMQTEVGQLIGTIPYMSPEQFSGVSANVDTRSDIYALGVICYELLTGRLPHDVSDVTIPQAARIITDEEPTSLTAVDRVFRGDVDTIVSKALDKDKNRRYQSALELAADIRRYLADEPISARPASTAYQLGKFARRNKALVGGAVATFLALLIGLIGISIQAARIAHERDHAQQAEKLAEQQRDEAERQAAIAEAINDFLNQDLLAAVDPLRAQGHEVTVLEVLENASGAIEGRFDEQPLVEAAVRHTLGETYMSLGRYDGAEPHLTRALDLRRRELGKGHLDTCKSLMAQGYLRIRQGRYNEAEPLFIQALEHFRRTLGEDGADTLSAKGVLGVLYRRQGRYAEAEELYVDVLDGRRRVLGEEHRHTLVSMNNLAILYRVQEKYDQAESLYLEGLEINRRVHGPDHPDTLNVLYSLAVLYKNQERHDEAERLYLQVIEGKRRTLGEDHPHTLLTLRNLATLYDFQEKEKQSEALYLQVLEASRRTLGDEHPETLDTMTGLAYVYYHMKQWEKAEALAKEAFEIRRRVLGDQHPDTLTTIGLMARLHQGQGRHEEAVRLFGELLEERRRAKGDDHRLTLAVLRRLVTSLIALERFEQAEPLATEGYERHQKVYEPTHEKTAETVDLLVHLYDAWNKPDQAAEYRALLPPDKPSSAKNAASEAGQETNGD